MNQEPGNGPLQGCSGEFCPLLHTHYALNAPAMLTGALGLGLSHKSHVGTPFVPSNANQNQPNKKTIHTLPASRLGSPHQPRSQAGIILSVCLACDTVGQLAGACPPCGIIAMSQRGESEETICRLCKTGLRATQNCLYNTLLAPMCVPCSPLLLRSSSLQRSSQPPEM